ncbi:WYL domain-containing protein [Micromonospora sp. NPDC023814]|uniref:WYL domain-containing protein n=1 Tax=Micromonospora sp. NPDC023814 TaxID=3154596 RepID=UPI0033EDDA9E
MVAGHTDRGAWRTFRVDRLRTRLPTGPRFAPEGPPDGDVTAHLSSGPWAVRATVTMHRPAATVVDLAWLGMGAVDPVDDDTCLLHPGHRVGRGPGLDGHLGRASTSP